MTDGTSQGLFIVVAIVIFGIFISLSYTVFGSMSDGLTGLFDTSLDVTYLQLSKGEVIYIDDVRAGNVASSNNIPSWYVIDGDVFEQDGVYTVSFDVEVTNGNLYSLRGHLHTSTDVSLFVNGVEQPKHDDTWRTFAAGVLFDEPYTVGDTVSFEVKFTADRYSDPLHHPGNYMGISPNVDYLDGVRLFEGDTTVNYRNVRVIKHN